MPRSPKNLTRRRLLHLYRVGLFTGLLFLIHHQHQWYVAQKRGALKQPVQREQVSAFFADAVSLSDWDPAHGGQNVLDVSGKSIGHVIQTSPDADRIVGFSGPSNALIAFGPDQKIKGVTVLQSEDTREHTAYVIKDTTFLQTWNGLDARTARDLRAIDGVSGATLTSMAIADGISLRLGGGKKTARFPDKITVEEVAAYLPDVASLHPLPDRRSLQRALSADGTLLGYATRTSPHADHMMGYQGPTDLLIILTPDQVVDHVAIRSSYDNEPFVGYTRDDEYFLNLFKGFALRDIAQLDMVDAGIDGVTGASKTSITAAEALIYTAGAVNDVYIPPPPKPLLDLSIREMGTMAVVALGLLLAFTPLKGIPRLRIAFQLLLVGYVGFVNGDMLSQALFVGWAQNGIAWQNAPALVFLSAAAVIAPICSSRQVYCSHLCPFGALQDLTRKIPASAKLPRTADKGLRLLPAMLLAAIVVIAMTHMPIGLVGLEPFDAFVFRIAGWATITIALIGLIASAFVTRAYCKYGCPTGMMLNFLRYSADSERFGRRDGVALGLLLLAIGLTILR